MNVVYVLLCKKGLKKDVPPNQKKKLKINSLFGLVFLGSHRCASLIPAHLWSPLFRSNLHSPQTNLAPENWWLEYEWFFGCFLYQVPLFYLTPLENNRHLIAAWVLCFFLKVPFFLFWGLGLVGCFHQTISWWDLWGEIFQQRRWRSQTAFGGRWSGTFFWKRLGAPKVANPKRLENTESGCVMVSFGVRVPLMLPKVPQSSVGILRVLSFYI